MNSLELKKIRIDNNLSQEEMADLVGKSKRAIQSWEQNVRKIPQSVVLLIERMAEDGKIGILESHEKEERHDYTTDKPFEKLSQHDKLDEIYKLSLAKLSMQENDIKFLNKKVDALKGIIEKQNDEMIRQRDYFAETIQLMKDMIKERAR